MATNGHRSTPVAAAAPVRLRPARGDGTLVSVDLVARLLGFRLLTLRAEVRVAPAPVEVVRRAAVTQRPARVAVSRPVGGTLADAAQAIRSGARDLQAARDLSAG